MNEMTLNMVKKLLQERMRKRIEEHPEDLTENLIDAVCLDCINFRLMLDKQKDALLGAVGDAPELLDMFLGNVQDSLQQLIEEEEDKSDAPDAQ